MSIKTFKFNHKNGSSVSILSENYDKAKRKLLNKFENFKLKDIEKIEIIDEEIENDKELLNKYKKYIEENKNIDKLEKKILSKMKENNKVDLNNKTEKVSGSKKPKKNNYKKRKHINLVKNITIKDYNVNIYKYYKEIKNLPGDPVGYDRSDKYFWYEITDSDNNIIKKGGKEDMYKHSLENAFSYISNEINNILD